MIPAKMEAQILRPQRNKLEIKGKLSYLESTHSWSLMNLRKAILEEFPQLKERISVFGYKMVLFHEYNDLEKSIKKLKREGEAVPILMWLIKEKS
jgi:hypothetical protein